MKVAIAKPLDKKAEAILGRKPTEDHPPDYAVFNVTQQEFEMLQDRIQYVEALGQEGRDVLLEDGSVVRIPPSENCAGVDPE